MSKLFIIKNIIFIAILLISMHSYARDVSLSYYEAIKYIGQIKTVCGIITDINDTNKALFINFGGKYPNHKFTNVIFDNVKHNFYGINFEIGNKLCTTGRIDIYRGIPEIKLSNINQLSR